jgi:hypothetical protein
VVVVTGDVGDREVLVRRRVELRDPDGRLRPNVYQAARGLELAAAAARVEAAERIAVEQAGASAATKRPTAQRQPAREPRPDRRVREEIERARAAEREGLRGIEFLADVRDDVLHREREEHDADDHREVRLDVCVAGESHLVSALELPEDPLAADREEVEVGKPKAR